MGLLVLYPLLIILINSFETSLPGGVASYSFAPWKAAFDSPTVLKSIVTTLQLTFWRQLIAFPVALGFVWLIARTDMPGRNWLEFMFWVAFFLPALTVVQGYIMMFDPQYGVVNKLLAKLPCRDGAEFPEILRHGRVCPCQKRHIIQRVEGSRGVQHG